MREAKAKLLRSIDAKMTGNKMPVHMDFAHVNFSVTEEHQSYKILTATEYRIGVNLSSTVLIDDDLDTRAREDKLHWSTKVIGRAIANEVYGELRDKLIELSVHVHRELRYDSPAHSIVDDLLEMIEYD